MTQIREQAEATVAAYVAGAALAGRVIPEDAVEAMIAAEERRLSHRAESPTTGNVAGAGMTINEAATALSTVGEMMSLRGLSRLLGREVSAEEYEQAQALSRDDLQRAAAGLDEATCATCGDTGILLTWRAVPGWAKRWEHADGSAVIDCHRCPVEVRRERNLSGTMPPEDYALSTFETFTPRDDRARRARDLVRGWAQRDDGLGTAFLILSGPVGVGKTHLAKAATLWRAERGERIHWTTATGMLESIKRTYDTAHVAGEMVLDRWIELPALAIDDLGAERPTEWSMATLEQVLSARYEAFAPTIITTNFTIEEIEARHGDRYGRLVSRLADSATARRTTYVSLSGTDRRAG